jgi:hypothetical protein
MSYYDDILSSRQVWGVEMVFWWRYHDGKRQESQFRLGLALEKVESQSRDGLPQRAAISMQFNFTLEEPRQLPIPSPPTTPRW